MKKERMQKERMNVANEHRDKQQVENDNRQTMQLNKYCLITNIEDMGWNGDIQALSLLKCPHNYIIMYNRDRGKFPCVTR